MSVRLRAVMMSLLCLPVFFACAADPSDTLSETLSAPFEADFNYILTADGVPVEGGIHVVKDGALMIGILSPEPYTGIRVEADLNGGGVYSLDYDGVSVEVPKEMLFNLGVLTAFFEDTFADAVDALPSNAFTDADGDFMFDAAYELHPCAAGFEYGGGEVNIVCDRESGIPLTAAYTADGIAVWLETTEFLKKETDGE